MARQAHAKGNRKMSLTVGLCLVAGVAGSFSSGGSQQNLSDCNSAVGPTKRLEALKPLDDSCDFPRVDAEGLTPELFRELFVLAKRPVIIENAMTGWRATEEFRWDNLQEIFGDLPLRVGAGPYPKERMTISEYLAHAETAFKDDDLAEVPGVFQYGQVPTSWSLWNHKDDCLPYVSYYLPSSEPIHDNFTAACNLLSMVQVPEFLSGDDSMNKPPNLVTHSGFLIGYAGSGIDFHQHQAAINLIFEGQKLWFMKVSDRVVAGYSELEAQHDVVVSKPAASANERYCARHRDTDPICLAHEEQEQLIKGYQERKRGKPLPRVEDKPRLQKKYATGAFADKIAAPKSTEELEADTKMLYCVQREGEIMYIPAGTQHAVQNLDKNFAMQMQFVQDQYKDQDVREDFLRRLLHDIDPSEPDPDADLMVKPDRD
ncbi:Hypothetical Protein FCC1311_098472 [Hondaea fermentalgiana]|uniref:JmjC domain-containing protein n=1 Tax=Hondaea fermentalgiana TaxID=2315210 RepID=A0A2R5GZY8_9STRA|nr:Hypothetical Protein FCC1311_098472 [Hondaea fermentalgiana]|eukprot:GBG33624.1 Hypothetical Protein FCC1311_098472 [Hondaea fermentalgiana]